MLKLIISLLVVAGVANASGGNNTQGCASSTSCRRRRSSTGGIVDVTAPVAGVWYPSNPVESISFLGCFSINATLPVLHNNIATIASISPEACFNACNNVNMKLFGISGNSCYCDNVFYDAEINTPVSMSNCNTSCSGNNSYNCGGSSSLVVYLAEPLAFTNNKAQGFPYYSFWQSNNININVLATCLDKNTQALSGIITSLGNVNSAIAHLNLVQVDVCSAYCRNSQFNGQGTYSLSYVEHGKCYCGNNFEMVVPVDMPFNPENNACTGSLVAMYYNTGAKCCGNNGIVTLCSADTLYCGSYKGFVCVQGECNPH